MTRSVRLYLFREEVQSLRQAVNSASPGWELWPIPNEDSDNVQFWVKPNSPSIPNLVDRYKGVVDITTIGSNVTSSSVLLLLIEGRVFAETTGYGRSLLLKHLLVEDFGSVLTSRFGDLNTFRSVESTIYGSASGTYTIQRKKGLPIAAMVPNGYHYHVRQIAVSSKSSSPNSRTEIGGVGYVDCDALTDVRARQDRLRFYLREYLGGSALPSFVNSARPTDLPRNSQESVELYRELLSEILDGNRDGKIQFWLSVDSSIATSGDCTLSIGRLNFDSTYLNEFDTSLVWQSRADWSVEHLVGTRVEIQSEGQVLDSMSLISCLHMELMMGGSFYIHDEGHWKRIPDDYISSLDRRIQEFEGDYRSMGLDIWRTDWNEDEYNIQMGGKDDWHCLHPSLWRGAGMRYGIELADLLHASGRLVHVKKYDDAEQFAYHLGQAKNAAASLALSSEARAWLDVQRAASSLPTSDFTNTTITIAIGSGSRAGVGDLLSSGVKLALSRSIDDILGLGNQVEVVWIPIQ